MPYDATRSEKFPYGRLVISPAIGSIVHYVLAPGYCAIRTVVAAEGLLVADWGSVPYLEYDQDGRAVGTWHYGCVHCQTQAGGVNEPVAAEARGT